MLVDSVSVSSSFRCAGFHGNAGVRGSSEEQGITRDRAGGPDRLGIWLCPVRTALGCVRLLPACLWEECFKGLRLIAFMWWSARVFVCACACACIFCPNPQMLLVWAKRIVPSSYGRLLHSLFSLSLSLFGLGEFTRGMLLCVHARACVCIASHVHMRTFATQVCFVLDYYQTRWLWSLQSVVSIFLNSKFHNPSLDPRRMRRARKRAHVCSVFSWTNLLV